MLPRLVLWLSYRMITTTRLILSSFVCLPHMSLLISTLGYIKHSAKNGLLKDSYVMTDKIVTVDKAVLGEKIGDLTKNDMLKISDQLKIILGLK